MQTISIAPCCITPSSNITPWHSYLRSYADLTLAKNKACHTYLCMMHAYGRAITLFVMVFTKNHE